MASKKKSTKKKRYGSDAAKKVERAMKKRKAGTLKSGGSGNKVTSKKQAIAIGLSEARSAGNKDPKKKTSAKRKTGSVKKKTGAPKKKTS